MVKRASILTFLLLCVFSAATFAVPLVLTPPTSNYLGYGAGGTRGDIITMTGNYTLTSIGIDAWINSGAQLTFNAYVYDDVGGVGINPLAIGSNVVFTGNGTEQFFNLPISYTLQNGVSYDIGIAFNSFNDPNLQINYYFFNSGTNAPFSVGPVTVTDGEESHCGPCNTLTPNLELNGSSSTTPEPGSLILLGTGAVGLLGSIRRKLIV
jgi:hypothetical protein